MAEKINILPKLRNNGDDNVKDDDCMDMLTAGDVDESLSIDKMQTKGIPKSILDDSALTECYGEMLPANCDTDCQLMCYYTIFHPQRKDIYKQFSMLHSVTEQNYKITQLIKIRRVEEQDECNPYYHLVTNSSTVKVCRKFFINTLGITEHRLDSVLKPINYSWYSDKDNAALMKAYAPKQTKVGSDERITPISHYTKKSLKRMSKNYNLKQLEIDSEVKQENVPHDE